jgi:hypothetical protein
LENKQVLPVLCYYIGVDCINRLYFHGQKCLRTGDSPRIVLRCSALSEIF